jgi:hypothetical protein
MMGHLCLNHHLHVTLTLCILNYCMDILNNRNNGLIIKISTPSFSYISSTSDIAGCTKLFGRLGSRLKWESMLRFKVLRENLKHETYPLVWLKDWGRSVWDLIAMLLSLASTQAADCMFVLRGSFKDWNLRMWVLLLLLFGQERKRAKERFCVSNLSHENENEWVITK